MPHLSNPNPGIQNTKPMKMKFKITLITMLLVVAPVLIFAQQPPHPNGGGTPTTGTNTQVGGNQGAPIGSGTFFLFTLAVAYAGRKVYVMRTAEAEE